MVVSDQSLVGDASGLSTPWIPGRNIIPDIMPAAGDRRELLQRAAVTSTGSISCGEYCDRRVLRSGRRYCCRHPYPHCERS
jgi:hypothetical protein